MLPLSGTRAGATIAGIAAVALLWGVAAAQWGGTEDVENPEDWVAVLDSALAEASDECKKRIEQAKEGLQFAIATGGLKWCWGADCQGRLRMDRRLLRTGVHGDSDRRADEGSDIHGPEGARGRPRCHVWGGDGP